MSDKNIDWEAIDDSELVDEINERGLSGEFTEHYSASDYSSEDLKEVLQARGKMSYGDTNLEKIWLHYRGKDVPQCLADYLWDTIGKAL